MNRFRSAITASLVGAAILLVVVTGCNLQSGQQSGQRKAPMTLFIGVDVSGSFKHDYDNAMTFLAHYIYGHLHELGGLAKPQALFVGSIGGKKPGEPKSFHPIHDFEGKDIDQIATELRTWFPPSDALTDFNSFFQEVARIAKERNLILAPITLMVVTDGIPDVPGAKAGSRALYEHIDLTPLEYLARSITIRLAYVSPKVGDQWRKNVPRQRVRLWTVDTEVMKGWKDQMQPGVDTAHQDRLWKWVQDNVDFRVRSAKL
ncbi:MAG TPA: hypothetical protein VE222_09400 [Nitrospiraceae bacterium]|nr:hypothetical protein [Nitrospiraceae bacterium]